MRLSTDSPPEDQLCEECGADLGKDPYPLSCRDPNCSSWTCGRWTCFREHREKHEAVEGNGT